MARTKRGQKPVWVKDPGISASHSSGTRETLHMHRKASCGSELEIMPGHNESCSSQKPSLWDPSWLRGECAPRGGSQGRSGGKRNQIIGLKKDKDPEELPYINDLTASLLRSPSLAADNHTLSLPCFYLNKPFPYMLSHLLLCYVSNYKFFTCIYSLCLHGKNIVHWRQRSGEK